MKNELESFPRYHWCEITCTFDISRECNGKYLRCHLLRIKRCGLCVGHSRLVSASDLLLRYLCVCYRRVPALSTRSHIQDYMLRSRSLDHRGLPRHHRCCGNTHHPPRQIPTLVNRVNRIYIVTRQNSRFRGRDERSRRPISNVHPRIARRGPSTSHYVYMSAHVESLVSQSQ